MNGNDLMERRVERGNPRGALTVLADAQAEVEMAGEIPRWGRSRWFLWLFIAFHFVISLAVLGFGAFGGTRDADTATDEPDRSIIGPTALTSNEPLPAPILVDDLDLVFTRRPSFDPFDADDLFGDGPPSTFFNPTSSAPFIIFGDPDASFDGPIFGVSVFNFAPIEFEVFSANMEPSRADELAEQVQVTSDGINGGTVALATETDLVEIVNRLDFFRPTNDQIWDFGFEEQNEYVSFTAATSRFPEDLNEWDSLYDILSQSGLTRMTLSSTQVLGQPGVRISATFEDSGFFTEFDFDGDFAEEGISVDDVFLDAVVWTQDDFAYTLNLFEPRRPVMDDLSRLRIADRAEWNTAVAQTDYRGQSTDFTVWRWAILLALLGFMAVNWKRPRKAYPFIAGALGLGFALLNYWFVANTLLMVGLIASFGFVMFWAGRTKLERTQAAPTSATFQLLE